MAAAILLSSQDLPRVQFTNSATISIGKLTNLTVRWRCVARQGYSYVATWHLVCVCFSMVRQTYLQLMSLWRNPGRSFCSAAKVYSSWNTTAFQARSCGCQRIHFHTARAPCFRKQQPGRPTTASCGRKWPMLDANSFRLTLASSCAVSIRHYNSMQL